MGWALQVRGKGFGKGGPLGVALSIEVVKIGEDTYLDAGGQIGNPGAVFTAIGHDLESATAVADSLSELVRQAGASSPLESNTSAGTTETRAEVSDSSSDEPSRMPVARHEATSLVWPTRSMCP